MSYLKAKNHISFPIGEGVCQDVEAFKNLHQSIIYNARLN